MSTRETVSHPQLQCCQSKKRLDLQCKSYQYNQQIVLQISSNSTFLSKGIRKGHAFRPGHHASHICYIAIVDLPTTCFNSQGRGMQTNSSNVQHRKLRSTCLLSSSSRYPGYKWGGPRTLLGLRGKAMYDK